MFRLALLVTLSALLLAGCEREPEAPGGAADRTPQGDMIRAAEADVLAARREADSLAAATTSRGPEPRTDEEVNGQNRP